MLSPTSITDNHGVSWAEVQWALEQGWSVFPLWGVIPSEEDGSWQCSCAAGASCDRAGKHPAVQGGHNAAVGLDSLGQVQRWFSREGAWNLGIRTGSVSGLLVVDADIRNRGLESLDDWERLTGLPWVNGAVVRTGSGGRHDYYRWPDEYLEEVTPVGGVLGALPGVDIKSDGGYVVGPGSRHISGKRYEWVGARDVGGSGVPVASLELMQWVIGVRGKSSGTGGGTEKPAGYDFVHCLKYGAPEGMRDAFFNELAFRLWVSGMTRAAVEERMRVEFDRAEPGHSWDRVLYQVERVFSMSDAERQSRGLRTSGSGGSGGVATGEQLSLATTLVDAYREKLASRADEAHGVAGDVAGGSEGGGEGVATVVVSDSLHRAGTGAGVGAGVPGENPRRPLHSAVLFDGRYLLFRDKAFEDLADAILDQWESDGRGLALWRGDFYLWVGTHWARVEDANDLRMRISVEVRGAMLVREKDGERTYSPWDLTITRVNEILKALERSPRVLRANDTEVEHGIISFANGVLDIRRETLAAFRDAGRAVGVTGGVQVADLPLIAHDRRRWITSCVPYAWNPTQVLGEAAWVSWLEQRVPDESDRAVLQEWFGYVLSGGKPWMHKFLYMQGLPRTGKSTAVRILKELVGAQGMYSFTSVGQVVERFALAPAIGKTCLHFNEVRWDFKGVSGSVDMLTQIIGGDEIQIDRKNREMWTGTHSGRVSMTSNNPPAFRNESGALLKRMIHVHFGNSFAGHENPDVEEELLQGVREGGLAAWAVRGLLRLMEVGRFSESSRSRVLKDEMQAEVSPVSAFVEEMYVVTRVEADEVGFKELHVRFLAWCAERGINPLGCGTINVFSRTLFSVVEGIGKWDRKEYTHAGKRTTVRGVWGLALRQG